MGSRWLIRKHKGQQPRRNPTLISRVLPRMGVRCGAESLTAGTPAMAAEAALLREERTQGALLRRRLACTSPC